MAETEKKKGIDITAAMEILVQRQQHKSALPQRAQDRETTQEECRCCGQQQQQQQQPQHGPSSNGGQQQQALHWLGGGDDSDLEKNDDSLPPTIHHPSERQQQQSLTTRPNWETTNNRLEMEISGLSLKERIHVVLQVQQERAATYRQFDEGLRQALTSGNVTLYPPLCAQVTATFAVLSRTVNAILQSPSKEEINNPLKGLLKQLQKHESNKLNYTAALHLEQMRQSVLVVVGGGGDDDDRHDPSPSILQSSIDSLRQKISKVVMDINEIVDELRCMLLEEDES